MLALRTSTWWSRPLVDYYRENGPSLLPRLTVLLNGDPFGMEGYLTLLVGQSLPYDRVYRPTDEEQRVWDAIRAENYIQAANGLTTSEVLAAILRSFLGLASRFL